MDPITLIKRYYPPEEKAFEVLVDHGTKVAQKALAVAKRVTGYALDLDFIREAAILHDIGMIHTRAYALGCFGIEPYIRHGVIGRRLLESEGLFRHALVCERHVGAGISEADIRSQGLPLPCRSMEPVTIEERIICYADKFFSKTADANAGEKSLGRVFTELSRLGEGTFTRFKTWVRQFEPELLDAPIPHYESHLR